MSDVKNFRQSFRNDEEYIHWVESRNTALNQEMNRMQLKLQQADDDKRLLEDELYAR